MHVWGAPTCVLESRLANGRSIPRWRPRSSRSIFVGNSVKQGHHVPLVLNLDTGKVTSQYHVVVDNWFQTVDASVQSQINFDHDDWCRTFGLTEHQCVPEDEQDAFDQAPQPLVSESEGATRAEIMRGIREFETAAVSPHQRERTTPVVQPSQSEQSRAAPSFDVVEPAATVPSQPALPQRSYIV